MLHTSAGLGDGSREQDDKGFTLIELLVVVVIIGVLVAIAIPLYLNYRTGSENRAAQSDVRNAVSAVEACMGDNSGKAPSGTGQKTQGGAIWLTCKTDGSGAASSTTSTGANQTINVSDGVTVQYDNVSSNTYKITGYYGPTTGVSGGHKTYTYTSASGKTVAS